MFGKKRPEDLTYEERKQIAKMVVESDFVMTSVSEAIQDTINDHRMKYWIEDRIKDQFNEQTLKGKVHSIMNSDPITEIIYEHLKNKINTMLNETQLIDESVQERVDAAGIDHVIQWNNAAYGMLLARLNDVDKKLKDKPAPAPFTERILSSLYAYYAEHGELPDPHMVYRAQKTR